MDPVGSWIAGAGTADLFLASKNAIKKTIHCKKYCKRLERTLQEITPTPDEIIQTGAELPQHRQRQQLQDFYDRLAKGKEIVQKCSEVRPYNVYHKFKYANKILALEKYISNKNWILDSAHILADVHRLKTLVSDGFTDIGRPIQELPESRERQPSIIENMSQMQIDEDIPELPECPVGLEISVDDLKKRLICKDISCVAIQGMGGSGKTTLAVALCRDPQLNEFFQGRIIFETISQSPNLKGIIKRMWTKIFQASEPDFQSDEDGHRQFQQKLQQMKPPPTLVVLDDVWNKHHLETLMFRAEGYKTLITTRNSIVEPNLQYELQLLREADALSLCFWAFQQQAIPETKEKDLVEKVIAE